MSYYIYDANGYIGDVASDKGWSDFCAWTDEAALGPATQELVDGGSTENVQQLRQELSTASASDPSAESVRAGLVGLAAKCQDVCIVTDGVGIADDSDEEDDE